MPECACVLATGGAGFIGSHVVAELAAAGYRVVILDNFENAAEDVPERLEAITATRIPVVRGDVGDTSVVTDALRRFGVDVVIHLAGKKAVGESVANPLLYYGANVGEGISLLAAMRAAGVGHLVFSSSATVYRPTARTLIDETAPLAPTNPYGRTKLMLEEIITDAVEARMLTSAISLRYFNPVGAHASGLIGEAPNATPSNLFPYIAQTAAGLHRHLEIFGDDYDTPDGTGIRDYIHVVDLARGHVAAIGHALAGGASARHLKLNLGTGTGHSVKQAVAAFSRASGVDIPIRVGARRPGDVARCVADPMRAAKLLGWRAEFSFERMCADHWAFHQRQAGLQDMHDVPVALPAAE